MFPTSSAKANTIFGVSSRGASKQVNHTKESSKVHYMTSQMEKIDFSHVFRKKAQKTGGRFTTSGNSSSITRRGENRITFCFSFLLPFSVAAAATFTHTHASYRHGVGLEMVWRLLPFWRFRFRFSLLMGGHPWQQTLVSIGAKSHL